jgi:hypothetical protein
MDSYISMGQKEHQPPSTGVIWHDSPIFTRKIQKSQTISIHFWVVDVWVITHVPRFTCSTHLVQALELAKLQVETSPFDGAFITGEGGIRGGKSRCTPWYTQ